MHVLLVEDKAPYADFVARGLRSEGYSVDIAPDAALALDRFGARQPDAVLLDLGLPDRDGMEVLRELRERDQRVPVIVITARDDLDAKVEGLDEGADDYLTKPFALAELTARLRAHTRARDQQSAASIEAGGVLLDLLRRTVRPAGGNGEGAETQEELTSTEFALLEFLMRHPGQVLSREVILDRVWGYDFDPQSNIVEVYVRYLRTKLPAGAIETVRGAGYRFRAAGG